MEFIKDCVLSVEQGNNLLIFPEATRSVPGRPLKLKRAAASVIAETQRKFVPVMITCKPPALSKAKKWYEIPSRKMHFKITVGDRVDPRPLIIEGEPLSKTNRRINAVLGELFLAGIEEHERSG
jgi:1-acyl-sn-glycerol-3-phosphate acyltransferase